MDKEEVVYIPNKILLSYKKNKILPFAMTWMGLESIMLSEISQSKKDKPYDFTYMWNLRKTNKQKKQAKEKKRERERERKTKKQILNYREQTDVYQKGAGWGNR